MITSVNRSHACGRSPSLVEYRHERPKCCGYGVRMAARSDQERSAMSMLITLMKTKVSPRGLSNLNNTVRIVTYALGRPRGSGIIEIRGDRVQVG